MAEELGGPVIEVIAEGAANAVAQAVVEIGVEGTVEAVTKNVEEKESLKWWVKLFVVVAMFALLGAVILIFGR